MDEEWRDVFSAKACEYLKLLHERFLPTYAISSSWSNYLTKTDMQLVFEKTGHKFVSTYMHEDWTTPKSSSSNRHAKISGWLAEHPGVESFLILDYLNSGHALHGSDLHGRTVFCTSVEGLNGACMLEAERILSHPFQELQK
ncbi:MAG: HAD domain-containing protein [Halobacteriota archaeon]